MACRSSRLSYPLIKTAALLITHADFAAVPTQVLVADPATQAAVAAAGAAGAAPPVGDSSSSGNSAFAWGVLQLLKQDIKGCGDVAKLLEAASLMAQLACSEGCSAAAIQSVMLMLVNRFPKV